MYENNRLYRIHSLGIYASLSVSWLSKFKLRKGGDLRRDQQVNVEEKDNTCLTHPKPHRYA
jgi:hypothetical protein